MLSGRVNVIRLLQADMSSSVFHIEKGSTVVFELCCELQQQYVRLFTNYPVEGDIFVRSKYRELEWSGKTTSTSKDTGLNPMRRASIVVNKSGNFDFRYECRLMQNLDPTTSYSGSLLVDPNVVVDGHRVSMRTLCMQTLLTPCLGALEDWESRMRVSSESGYNAIHLSPVQELGASKSAYCLRHHDRLDPVAQGNLEPKDAQDKLVALLRRCRMSKSEGGMGLLVFQDVVWNHAAADAPWLAEHPDCGYNLVNSPWLWPAVVFDLAFQQFSNDLADGKIEFGSLADPKRPLTEQDIDVLLDYFFRERVPALCLWEFFVADVDKSIDEFFRHIEGSASRDIEEPLGKVAFKVLETGGRGSVVLDVETAINVYGLHRIRFQSKDDHISCVLRALRKQIEIMNLDAHNQLNAYLASARTNMRNQMVYEWIAPHGPRHGTVTRQQPLLQRNFTVLPQANFYEEDVMCKSIDPTYILANNGWVWNSEHALDFAERGSQAYLCREVLVWSDSVKFRYGRCPEDSPWLWRHMEEYTSWVAERFDGLRIDNCHSTPLHVGSHLIDVARRVRDDIFVMAELFTGSQKQDSLFANRLGLNALIRESYGSHDTESFCKMLYEFGGDPIGTFREVSLKERELRPSLPYALFMDATHDNEPIARKFSLLAALPISALISGVNNGVGSTRGYDELAHKWARVVNETHRFPAWKDAQHPDGLTSDVGIIAAKAVLNSVHINLESLKFDEVFVDRISDTVVAVTRQNSLTLAAVVFVANTAFNKDKAAAWQPGQSVALSTTNPVQNVLMSAVPRKQTGVTPTQAATPPAPSDEYSGIADYLDLSMNVEPGKCPFLQETNKSNVILIKDLPPGGVLVLEVPADPKARNAMRTVQARLGWVETYGEKLKRFHPSGSLFKSEATLLFKTAGSLEELATQEQPFHELSRRCEKELNEAVGNLNLLQLNYLLYRCDAEEKNMKNRSAYDVPGFGPLVYCGIAGCEYLLAEIRRRNDLGHPLCNNLRQGTWLAGYMLSRMRDGDEFQKLVQWLQPLVKELELIPSSYRPSIFSTVIRTLYRALYERAITCMSKYVQDGDDFVQALAMTSVALVGLDSTGRSWQETPTLAAGLPHFAVGWARCWGRDTFISLRGLLLVTGRYDVARTQIILFAECVRHGMVPNLFNHGENSRYNARDAVWWFLQAIQDYCTFAPEGLGLLKTQINMRYPHDDQETHSQLRGARHPRLLSDIIQDIMELHARGISYREWGAGPDLDRDMTEPGFNVAVRLDRATGFLYGGNPYNCGTWMDKMGSSHLGGNKGVPATPRDGAAVELTGLLKSTVRWLADLYDKTLYRFGGVSAQGGCHSLSYRQWNDLLQESFEQHYYVPEKPKEDLQFRIDQSLVNRRGIYKDSVASSSRFTDYQLRPNQFVAMVVAPELFTPERARAAIALGESCLLGAMGMRTLDPADWNYRPNYEMVDSNTKAIAQGWNYHQGPEWVWCLGYFLRAKLHFSNDKSADVQSIRRILTARKQHLLSSPWRGMTELCNENGSFCSASSPIQAWSSACLLDILYDLDHTNL
eukprot:m.146643 g.146643  ORF g.146643 m.146643 type:complete len:1557 (-) comp16812_c0_seq2:328-4998(-)